MTTTAPFFRKFKVLSALLALALILGVASFGHVSNAYTSVGTNDIQDRLLSPLVNPINPTYIIVDEAALNLLGKPLPSQVTLTLSASYNGGAPYSVSSCTVYTLGGSVASCLLSAPLKGWGHYLFMGSVYASNGTMLTQAGIDPYIEPEW
ncbi:MAG: hypothetical protein ACRECH_11785 [Nitrososphaerales archaeon]